MLTPQQFKERWTREEDQFLNVFPESSLSDVRLPANAHAFLIGAGLPADAAPFLNFEPPKSGTLPKVSVAWHQPPAFDRFRIIGGNGSGDPVCLDESADGAVVFLIHDNDFQRVLMGSSVMTLAECLLELRDLISTAGDDTASVSVEQYDRLLERLRAIDPAACTPNGFWPVEIEMLKPPPPKKWWRLWRA